MLRIEKFQQEKVQLWNNFNKNAKNGLFMFDRSYMDYHRDRFKDHSLMFYDEDKLIAIFAPYIFVGTGTWRI